MSEKRIDPDDGKAYSFEEFSAHYKGTYKKGEIKSYFEGLKIKGAKAQAKTKAKAKAKAAVKKDKAEPKEPKKRLKIGDTVPDVCLHDGFPPKMVSLPELCKGKKIVLVGLPGAYTPT